MTFQNFCHAHDVDAAEYVELALYLAFLRMRDTLRWLLREYLGTV